MMHSSWLCTGVDKSEKLSESIVVTASQCTREEIQRCFEKGDYQSIVAKWHAVMCSGCVPGGVTLSQMIESMQRVGMQAQTIAGDVRRALKQNAGLCADVDSLCHLLQDLRL